MIHDYYLSKANIKRFEDWNREKENSFRNRKKYQWRNKSKEEKYELWLEEVFVKPLAEIKRQIIEELKKDKDFRDFYPELSDLQNLPDNSVLIKISFTFKKPYTSKDEGEFHIINGRIFENPIVRDKFTGLPMVRPSTWKGHLRFAAKMVNLEGKKKDIIKRLFGSEPESEEALKGRLYFFPTFFEDGAKKDVITPLKRDTRTPARGPIHIEVMEPGSKGEFYILYVPYPQYKDFKEEQIKEDLKFLAEALRLMFYTYGFSAKKTSGFGVIKEKLNEGKIWINTPEGIKDADFHDLSELKDKITELFDNGDNNE